MPFFEYKCPECGYSVTEFFTPGADIPDDIGCRECLGDAKKQFSLTANTIIPDRHKAINDNCPLMAEHRQWVNSPEFQSQVGEPGSGATYRRGTEAELRNLRGTL